MIDHLSDPPCSVSVSSCREAAILKSLQENEFEELSPLHERIYMVPSDQYLFYLLWQILQPATRHTLAHTIYKAPRDVTDKINDLIILGENPIGLQRTLSSTL